MLIFFHPFKFGPKYMSRYTAEPGFRLGGDLKKKNLDSMNYPMNSPSVFFWRQQLPEFPLKCDKSLAVKNICLPCFGQSKCSTPRI